MKPVIDCVGFLLIKNNKILIEKRKSTKRVDPNKYCIPSGGIEKGETAEEATIREVKEEFGVTAKATTYIGSLIYPTQEVDFDVKYFVVNNWNGEIKTLEAEQLSWREINPNSVDIWPDKHIIQVLKRRGIHNE